MKRMLIVLCFGMLIVFAMTSVAGAGMFVATAKNLRGALYQGYGPTPGHASEMAIVKCSQDSFIPPTCRVICVRMEMPPMAMAPAKVRKPVRKSLHRAMNYPRNYSWGRTQP